MTEREGLPRAEEWERLAALRERFLAFELEPPVRGDYWDDALLGLYDRTFAERIGWKWDAVLAELRARGVRPPVGRVLDWGCGSGVAARRFVGACGATEVRCLDASSAAERFAAARLVATEPELRVGVGAYGPGSVPDVLLVSHVSTELPEDELRELVDLARACAFVLWIEPGSRVASRRLGRVREALLPAFHVLAPCTHQATCGLQSPARERDWCHNFARPPADVHQDPLWSAFSRELGIDLRVLPYAFLALERAGADRANPDPGSDAASRPTTRWLGRARMEKGRALVDACNAAGVHTHVIAKRDDPQLFRSLRRGLPEPPLA